ncbi:25S rRNA (uridine(2843)-N(3))-methyltransferase [Lachnellula suecica]|uniref:25S rRNA (Uridine(2843)-N(3))-methyltransferase n=1 Tax=Lachnellula suecica TaxID=602035 RepID=A0A8T9C9Y6_9HELO|nr:25S rRNA (uridine(2843)-N(3))-methyltransferase [Lachnellula suecica]
MGRNGRLKASGKVVGKENDGWPGWKGPGFVKKQEPKPAPKSKSKIAKSSQETPDEKEDSAPESLIPIELQQVLLNVFRDSFPEVLASETLQPLLQDVKAALYERDFARAFGKSEYLEAYSIRWSPSRALCYLSILIDLREHFTEINQPCTKNQPPNGTGAFITTGPDAALQHQSLDPASQPADVLEPGLRATCFGGGAAEIIALGGFCRYMRNASHAMKTGVQNPTDVETSMMTSLSLSENLPKINLLLLDEAQWQDVVHKLHSGLTTPPPMSKYASSAAKAANSSLIADGDIAATFRAEDVLAATQSQLNDVLGTGPMLLTLLFTLNELYTTSIAKTTAFLLKLTMAAKSGTLLLVVDSPGSYSETTIGTEAKKYPMLWLMDHTLLEAQNGGKGDVKKTPASWEKVISEESKWFRMPDELRYPIPLENMRYQMHLYRRV